MKKYKTYIITIITSITLFILILYINNISPFGNNMLGKSDAINQFKPLLYDFAMKIKTGTLLNYSFNNGLGNPTMFNYLYYLASPINLIAILFNDPNIMYLSVIIIKTTITCICMTYYVSKKTNNNYIIIISVLSYVLSGWFLAYYYYLPWLDIFMIFPLFNYGLEQLLDNHKYHTYIFTLSYMMYTNLYLCFPVCVYTMLYFIIYEFYHKEIKIKKRILTFDYITLSTITSFLLSFFFLYGWFDSIVKMKLGFNKELAANYHTSINMFINSLIYPNTSFITSMSGKTFPNICLPCIITIGFIYFFLNKNIKRKNKIF